MRTTKILCSVATLSLLVACGGGDAQYAGGNGAGGTSPAHCQNLESEHDQLINAPTDAVVVNKTPAVPSE
jgi:hypothetical protein